MKLSMTIFALALCSKIYAAPVIEDQQIKTCLAAENIKLQTCKDMTKPECKDADKKFINSNCDKIKHTVYELNGKKGNLIVAKSEDGKSIWVLETTTSSMIKIQ
jgi:hypothetical protein